MMSYGTFNYSYKVGITISAESYSFVLISQSNIKET